MLRLTRNFKWENQLIGYLEVVSPGKAARIAGGGARHVVAAQVETESKT
jgi:hypothetical protein